MRITIMMEEDNDLLVDQLIRQYDQTNMHMPDIECEPHLLISKVRKHYMEEVIKLLSVNYETHQKLLNKNVYLPSAIWRCAKNIEMTAVQACMVTQLYRKNILSVIKDLKKDTQKGKLNKKLYNCLRNPGNEKKTQASFSVGKECNCQCTCNQIKRRRITGNSPRLSTNESQLSSLSIETSVSFGTDVHVNHDSNKPLTTLNLTATTTSHTPVHVPATPKMPPPNASVRIDPQDSDDLMMQFEKLFQEDPTDDDLFSLFDNNDSIINTNNNKIRNDGIPNKQDEMIIDKISTNNSQTLDDRLASLAGILVNNEPSQDPKPEHVKPKRSNTNKWLCEEYFLKLQLFELFDQLRDTNRQKLSRIKEILASLFGDDSDDEEVMSPLEETPEFVISCKERIAPWVVKLLTPYYIKGRIRGKALFKTLAKHLIRLIYQCSRYPQEYEVNSFVSDFLMNHKMIRCEADFKEFRIENI